MIGEIWISCSKMSKLFQIISISEVSHLQHENQRLKSILEVETVKMIQRQ